MKRWRREPRETGLRAVCQGVRGYEYRENGQLIAKVAPLTRNRLGVIGWYWYGDGINTASRNPPFATPEEAVNEATAHFANYGLNTLDPDYDNRIEEEEETETQGEEE